MIARVLIVPLLIAAPAYGQGFAGLGTEAGDFGAVTPDRSLEFPKDHLPHPAYRIEWWYLTANLEAADGTEYGLQWTLFRSARRYFHIRGLGSGSALDGSCRADLG